jgi:hypothetical protein
MLTGSRCAGRLATIMVIFVATSGAALGQSGFVGFGGLCQPLPTSALIYGLTH